MCGPRSPARPVSSSPGRGSLPEKGLETPGLGKPLPRAGPDCRAAHLRGRNKECPRPTVLPLTLPNPNNPTHPVLCPFFRWEKRGQGRWDCPGEQAGMPEEAG